MPPVTRPPWRNLKQTFDFAPVCPQQLPQIRNESAALKVMGQGRLRALQQIVPKLKNQSEDCLYLNVYAPAKGKAQTVYRNIILLSDELRYYCQIKCTIRNYFTFLS